MTIRTTKSERLTITARPTLLQLRDELDAAIADGGDATITEAIIEDLGRVSWGGEGANLTEVSIVAERAL